MNQGGPTENPDQSSDSPIEDGWADDILARAKERAAGTEPEVPETTPPAEVPAAPVAPLNPESSSEVSPPPPTPTMPPAAATTPSVPQPPRSVVEEEDFDLGLPGAFATTVRGVMEWVGVIAGAFVVALVVKTFLFQAYYIPSPSMEATLEISDRIMVNKLSYQLHDVNRGDIIVFKNPEGASGGIEDLIKRVVGLPGETVQVQGGRVYIDESLLLEPYLAAQDITGSFRKPPGCVGSNDAPDQCTVADGYVFVMGDNRPNSKDSRIFGPIPVDSIEGRAFLRVWPLGRFGRL